MITTPGSKIIAIWTGTRLSDWKLNDNSFLVFWQVCIKFFFIWHYKKKNSKWNLKICGHNFFWNFWIFHAISCNFRELAVSNFLTSWSTESPWLWGNYTWLLIGRPGFKSRHGRNFCHFFSIWNVLGFKSRCQLIFFIKNLFPFDM